MAMISALSLGHNTGKPVPFSREFTIGKEFIPLWRASLFEIDPTYPD